MLAAGASTVGAQTTVPTPTVLRLTVDDAVRLALEHNVDLNVDRLDPQIADTAVAAAASVYRPTVTSSLQQNNQSQPPASFFFPTATQSNAFTSTAGVSQRLPKFGGSYSASWNAVHTDSNSILNSFNPLLQSGLLLTFSQPLLRDRLIDAPRHELATSRLNRTIADTRLRESIVHTTADVKAAYWNLVSAVADVGARQSAFDLAQELVRVNKAKVEGGTAPPLDLLSAQAEAASDEEQLIIAQTAVKQAEDRLRLLIFDAADGSVWSVVIEASDAPPTGTITPDVDAAVAAALTQRADLARAQQDIETAAADVTFTGNQRLPDVRVSASYAGNGLGGTPLLRTGPFPGTVVGSGTSTSLGSVLSQLVTNNYPTWTAGVSIAYPVGRSAEDANYARAKLQRAQAEERLRSAQARVIQQVRDAAWKMEMNTKRMATTRVARALAEQRLDAERKRLDVGLSTSFLVIQAQRDLAQAKVNELTAVLAYDLSLVDFEALQLAGPEGQAPASPGPSASSPLATTAASPTTPAPTPLSTAGAASIPGLGGLGR